MEEPKGMSTGTVGSPPSSRDALIPALNSGLWAAVSSHAKCFKDTYFPADSGAIDARITENLCNLKSLCTKLNGNLLDPKSKSKGKGKIIGHASFANEEQLQSVVADILAELSKGDGVSTFEFIGSGVVASLLNYFSCGTFSKENVTEVNLLNLRQQEIKRFKLFIEIALSLDYEEGREVPMKVLVKQITKRISFVQNVFQLS